MGFHVTEITLSSSFQAEYHVILHGLSVEKRCLRKPNVKVKLGDRNPEALPSQENSSIFIYFTFYSLASFRSWIPALPSMSQWLKHCPIPQRAKGMIPHQGTCLGCEFNPQSGHMGEVAD